jgi:ADP-ribose pyrophosphatase
MFKKHKVLKTIRELPFGTYFSVKEILVEAPNKVQAHYFIRQAEDFSIVIPFLDKETLIMIRQHRVGSDQISLEFPMGTATKHSAVEMAQIELLEETGYSAKEYKKIGLFYITSSSSPQAAHVFIAKNVEKTHKQSLEPTENISVEKVQFSALRQMIQTGEITDGATIAAFGQYLNTL